MSDLEITLLLPPCAQIGCDYKDQGSGVPLLHAGTTGLSEELNEETGVFSLQFKSEIRTHSWESGTAHEAVGL